MSSSARKLEEHEIRQALLSLPGWRLEQNKLCTSYTFRDFSTAWAFMTMCAIAAEKIDHHPSWKNVYNRVEIALWTHDCSAVTDKDLLLAKQFTDFAQRLL